MTSPVRAHDLILCLTPFGEPDAALAAAATAAGALGILDLGTGDRRSREQLSRLRTASPGPFGVRVTGRCTLAPADLGAAVDTVVLTPDAPWTADELPAESRVLTEVTDLGQARAAVRAGARGLIARGAESGGRVGELSTFVLLQHLLGDEELSGIPVWACGGIGPRTAAAAVAGGRPASSSTANSPCWPSRSCPRRSGRYCGPWTAPRPCCWAATGSCGDAARARRSRPPTTPKRSRPCWAPASRAADCSRWARTASSPPGSRSGGAMCAGSYADCRRRCVRWPGPCRHRRGRWTRWPGLRRHRRGWPGPCADTAGGQGAAARLGHEPGAGYPAAGRAGGP
ncbi:hypothetical protein LT493_27150 [Streptomyces tricolor]|nr:hypothetical protein [Streptomyces tricolor]